LPNPHQQGVIAKMVVAAVVWTYWIAYPLFAFAVGGPVSLGAGYLLSVAKPYYDRRAQWQADELAEQRRKHQERGGSSLSAAR
jgi:hypothetical protein